MNNKNQDQWDAQYYKQHSDCQFSRGVSLLDKLNLKETDHVLDVGCGDGRITAEIAKRVPRGTVLGIDFSANMIEEAENSFFDIENLSFEQANIMTFDADPVFDRVFSSACFHWVSDHAAALKNIFNALKPGGTLVVSMGAEDTGPIRGVLSSEKWAPVLPGNQEGFYFPESLASLKQQLEECGFVNVKTELHQRARCFKDLQEICAWALAWIPAATGLHQSQAGEVAMDIALAVQADGKASGKLCLKAPNVVAYAHRP